MSDLPADERYGYRDPARRARLDAAISRGARIVFWAILHFGLLLAEQVAEVLAPLAFLAGLVWWAVLRVAATIQLDDPGLQRLVERLPGTLTLDGHVLTPGGLVTDGLWLMAAVAACRTLSGVIAKET